MPAYFNLQSNIFHCIIIIIRDFFLLLFTSVKNAMLYATKNKKNALKMIFKATKMLFKAIKMLFKAAKLLFKATMGIINII